MLRAFLPPLCLVLALAQLIVAFTLLSVGEPEVDVEIHRARVESTEEHVAALEDRLARRQWGYRGLIAGLFVGAVATTVIGFRTIGPSRRG